MTSRKPLFNSRGAFYLYAATCSGLDVAKRCSIRFATLLATLDGF